MSSIPNFAIPHPRTGFPKLRPRKRSMFSQLVRIAAAPSLITLGAGVLAIEHLCRRLRRDRSGLALPVG